MSAGFKSIKDLAESKFGNNLQDGRISRHAGLIPLPFVAMRLLRAMRLCFK